MKKRNTIVALTINLLIVIFEVIGLIMSIKEQQWRLFRYYTQDSNVIAMIGCGYLAFDQLLVLLGKREAVSKFATLGKYVSVCLLSVTFLVVIFVLCPLYGGGEAFVWMLFSGTMLYHHLLCPILAFVSFLFFENDGQIQRDAVKFALIPTIVYAAIAVLLNLLRVMNGPYPFLKVYEQPFYLSLVWFVVILGGAYGIAYCIYRLKNRRYETTLVKEG